ncbi:RDD family protein [Bdellovibrionota bacterium FG-2]
MAHLRVSVLNRVVAKSIDLVLVIAVSIAFPYPVGPLVGFLYSLFADGITRAGFHGQSLGKRVLNLRVVSTKRGGSATFRDSLLRNAPVGIATFFALIPVWGWLILILVGIPLMLIEVYLMATVAAGHRLGDVLGDTEVVESHAPKKYQDTLPAGH